MNAIRSSFLAGVAAASLVAADTAAAQPASHSDVPDTFRIEAGGFRIGADTNLTFNNGIGPADPVDFELLEVPESTTRFYAEGFWRPWRRHQFSLSFYRNAREGAPQTVSRDFTWGDRVITAGGSAQGRVSSNYFSGVYRFAAYKNERFEVGPSVGIGYLSLEAGLRGELSIAGTDSPTVPFDIAKDTGQPTGDLGGYFYWWPARRLLVRGEGRYIIVKPGNAEASVAEGRGAVVYHVLRNVGIGLQYNYTKFRYDRDILSRELGGSLRYSGGQVVLTGAF